MDHVLYLLSYDKDLELSIVILLSTYTSRTETLTGNHTRMSICMLGPDKPVFRDTISIWIKDIMKQANIDPGILSTHGTHASSTSTANIPTLCALLFLCP